MQLEDEELMVHPLPEQNTSQLDCLWFLVDMSKLGDDQWSGSQHSHHIVQDNRHPDTVCSHTNYPEDTHGRPHSQ